MLAACAGSIYSLATGAQYIQTGKYRRVLCIGAEALSRITDFTDRGTCILLADAAGAVVLEATEDGSGIIDVDLYSDGKYWDLLYMPGGGARHPATHETVDQKLHYARMKGNEVFKVAVRMFVECTEKILTRNGFTADDVKLFIPHQANLRIIEAACKRLTCRWIACSSTWTATATPARPRSTSRMEEAIAAGRLQGATWCCSPPSAAASPGAPPSYGGDLSVP